MISSRTACRVVSPEDRFESVKHCVAINKILRLK